MAKVHIFRDNYLLVPDAVSDEDASSGIDGALAEKAFGPLPYWRGGVLLPVSASIPPGWRQFSVRQTVADLCTSPAVPGIGGRGAEILRLFHLLQWRNESAYCGTCGEKNKDDDAETARRCPRCGRIEFPRISPAVIVLVVNDADEALLAHNKKFKDGVYSLIAGFCEAGESLEKAAVREIKEEVGVEISGLNFIASQPWPFPNSLMAGFTAHYLCGDIKPDGAEIEDARWYSRESVKAGIPAIPARGSISRFLIERWLNS